MSTRVKVEAVAGALFLVLLGLMGWMWLQAHDAALKAEVTVHLLQQQRSEVKQETVQKVEDVHAARTAAKSEQEQVRYVTQYVPVHLAEPESAKLDGQIPYLELPTADLPKLADYVEQFNVNKVKLDGCQKELNLCDAQVKALQSGRKTGFWNRAKWFAIGAGAGAGVIAATRR